MKNYFISIVATVIGGPFGVMYSSIMTGMLLIPVMMFFAFVGPQVFLLGWISCTLIGLFMTASRNSDEALRREHMAEMARIVSSVKAENRDE